MKYCRRSRTLVVLVALVFSACGPFKAKVDPTRFYALKGTSTSRLSNQSRMVVGVGPVVIPGYLDHKEIVTSGAAGDLLLAEFDVWAEPLDKAVTRVVAKNLSQLLGSPSVVPFPDADADYDYKAGIVVRRFEMGADQKVRLDASYSITGRPGVDRSSRSRSKSITVPVSQPELYASVADAMSRALSELSTAIARDLIAQDG